MKKSRFTEEKIAFALKQNELGVTVEEVSRKMGKSTVGLPLHQLGPLLGGQVNSEEALATTLSN